MVIGKIKPAATVVAQFAAGIEVEAIQHEGKIFLPVIAMGEFATKDTGDTAPKKTEPVVEKSSKKTEEKASDEKPSTAKTYTEDELMEMSTKDL